MVVLDHLALLVARRRSHETSASKGDPLGKAVEVLALVGCRADQLPELDRAEVTQQEDGADHTPKLAESEVEPVFAAVRGEAAQDCRGQKPAGSH